PDKCQPVPIPAFPRTAGPSRGTPLAHGFRYLCQEGSSVSEPATQRIAAVRRDYNRWVADETMEDYALRFTPRAFRKWTEFRIANTALGAVSFLALEAIGGALVLAYGFTTTVWAILAAALLIFLTGLPISYHAARSGLD